MNRRIGGSALPLRGYKFGKWEGGMREPTVMWWPGRIPAGRQCHEIAGTIDLLPTIAALSGANLPVKKIDGKSIIALIEGTKGAKSPHEAYFYRTEAVRCGKWKLKKNELFDLSEDVSESKNVAKQNPEVVTQLKKLLDEHKRELKKNKRPCGIVGNK
jgi:arylsulfatase A-like enzyme